MRERIFANKEKQLNVTLYLFRLKGGTNLLKAGTNLSSYLTSRFNSAEFFGLMLEL